MDKISELTDEQKATYLIYNKFLEHISKKIITERSEIDIILNKINLKTCGQFKINCLKRNPTLKNCYKFLVDKHFILPNEDFELLLRNKATKSNSGIVVLSIALEGRMFSDIKSRKYPKLVFPNHKYQDIVDIIPTKNSDKEKGGCEFNCHFCPFETKEKNIGLNKDRNAIGEEIKVNVNKNIVSYDEKGEICGTTMARSYLSSEGVFMRGMICDFLPDIQVFRRLIELERLGHNIDKIVFIPRGATASNFSNEYWEIFIRDVFWACNQYYHISIKQNGILKNKIQEWLIENPFANGLPFDIDNSIRKILAPKLSLAQEKEINETSPLARIVEIAIEDRPDVIVANPSQLMFYRQLGCTSFETGIQHTNNRILSISNRGHNIIAPIKCLRMVSDAYFKTHTHIMTDLPGSSPKDDLLMLLRIYTDNDLVFYNVKNYPCLPIPFAEIYKWRERWLDYVKNNEYKAINDIKSRMSDSVQYRKMKKDEYIWVPYAETNYDDFLKVMLIAVAGISIEDANYFNINLKDYTKYDLVYRHKGNPGNWSIWNNYYSSPNYGHRYFLNPADERKSRIQRDFPTGSDKNNYNGYISSTQQSNLAQILKDRAKYMGHNMFDIRSREIRDNKISDFSKCRLYIRCKRANRGIELTLSVESFKINMINFDDTYLLGLLRIRFRNYDIEKQYHLNNNIYFNKPPPIHYLDDFTNPGQTIVGITELHVFGVTLLSTDKTSNSNNQHKGIGKFLLSVAEYIIKDLGFRYVCVISGVGVRKYYNHLGYMNHPGKGEYLVKDLGKQTCGIRDLFDTRYDPNSISKCVRNFEIIKTDFRKYDSDFVFKKLPWSGIFIYNHPLIQNGDYETGIISGTHNLVKNIIYIYLIYIWKVLIRLYMIILRRGF
jgi:histone acetyltransferase (RNA polymerase elongator complex component)